MLDSHVIKIANFKLKWNNFTITIILDLVDISSFKII